MQLPSDTAATTGGRREVYETDDDLPGYHESGRWQAAPPPPYEYPLASLMLWWGFAAIICGFAIASAGAVGARAMELEGRFKGELGGRMDIETSGKRVQMWSLPANLMEQHSGLHQGVNALAMGAASVVLLQAVARHVCPARRIPSWMHLVVICLVAASTGLCVASQAYLAGQLAKSSRFEWELVGKMALVWRGSSPAMGAVLYTEGVFALESWACQVHEQYKLRDGARISSFAVQTQVCGMEQDRRYWGIAAAAFSAAVLVALVVDWRFQLFVRRRAGKQATTAGAGDVGM